MLTAWVGHRGVDLAGHYIYTEYDGTNYTTLDDEL